MASTKIRRRYSRTCACSATCTYRTRGRFAQGHDARMVSLLVKQVVATEIDAEVAAQRIREAGGSSALVEKLHRAIANAEAKAARKAAKAAPKTVTAKVGRWTYEGQVRADGRFHYRDRSGRAKVVVKFELV